MQDIRNVSKNRQGKQKDRQNSGREPESYLCAVCGGERYHLVLTAEALKNRVGLKLRCGTCHASQDATDSVRPPRHAVFHRGAPRQDPGYPSGMVMDDLSANMQVDILPRRDL